VFAMAARAGGHKPPSIELPIAPLIPVALVCEALARFGIEPVVTRETLAMARKKMFFSSAKARRELGYAPRNAAQAIDDAVKWFRHDTALTTTGRLDKGHASDI
jgi:dihydroflavonol-4-reductase